MPLDSSPAIEKRLRNNTPYSSTVLVREVATRQLANSRLYCGGSSGSPPGCTLATRAKTPSTVFVFPTSITRSIDLFPAPISRELCRLGPFALHVVFAPAESPVHPGLLSSLQRQSHSLQCGLSFQTPTRIAARISAGSILARPYLPPIADTRGRVILAKRRPVPRATIRFPSQAAMM